jgi:hypothetical protein
MAVRADQVKEKRFRSAADADRRMSCAGRKALMIRTAAGLPAAFSSRVFRFRERRAINTCLHVIEERLMRPTTGFRPATRFANATRRDGPAARNTRHERTLANAIGGLWVVELRVDGIPAPRPFAPHALFRTANGGVCVSGRWLDEDGDEPEVLVVGRITSLAITSESFEPDPGFRRADPRFEGGVICSV